MAAPINPGSSKAFGREKWIFVPTIANTSAPTTAELTGASALDVSCYLFDPNFTRPSQNTNTVTKTRRVCDTVQYSQIGITQFSGGELTYAFDPQAAALSNGKKAWEKFGSGAVSATTSGYLVRRNGIDVNTDIAAGQFVDVFPAEIGPGMPTTVGDGEAAENAAMHVFTITAAPAPNKAVV